MPLPFAAMLLRLAGGAAARLGTYASTMAPTMTRMLGGSAARLGTYASTMAPTMTRMLGGSGMSGMAGRASGAAGIPGPVIKPNLKEIGAMRARLASAGPLKWQQRMMLRHQLAQQLVPLRREKQREREERKSRESQPGFSDFSRSMGMATLKTTSFFTAAGLATRGLTKLARSSNEAAIESLKRYSPRLAALSQQREVFDMQQLIRRGQLVGPSTERLTEQLMALKAHSNAYSALGENVTNALKEIPVRTADGFLTILDTIGVTELVKALNKLFGVDSKKEKEGQSNELLRRLDKISRGTMIGGGALNRRPNERPGGRF